MGKDISDSLGGAVYNAILNVDINELDYIENITITNNSSTLTNFNNGVDHLFGFTQNPITKAIEMISTEESINDNEIEEIIESQINTNKQIVDKVKQNNKETKLTDQELLDLYNNFNGDGMILF